jgi:hypothetical protein
LGRISLKDSLPKQNLGLILDLFTGGPLTGIFDVGMRFLPGTITHQQIWGQDPVSGEETELQIFQ